MDPLSILGILVGLGAVLAGNFLDGGHFQALLNGPALMIVLGGTCGAMLLQSPPAIFLRAMKILIWVVKPQKIDLREQIRQIVDWGTLARRKGMLVLEDVIPEEKDVFIRKGLQLLVDGNQPTVIRDCLETELNNLEQHNLQAAKVFESMGGYAPTIGILGAVMGLTHVLQNLSDPDKLGNGVATAFVATIYGVAMANLLFLPIANKLKAQAHAITQSRELIIEGIIAIAEGQNPQNISVKLSGFLLDAQDGDGGRP